MRVARHILSFGLGLLVGAGLLIGLACLRAVTYQGVNYRVQAMPIPLSIKLLELIDRDYWYRRLARSITAGHQSEESKALALFDWTTQHIHANWPRDWSIVDDHIWHTIIRGYGTTDQCAAVLATLCVYAGLPAASVRATAASNPQIWMTFVMVFWDGAWHVFDPYHGVVFWNDLHRSRPWLI